MFGLFSNKKNQPERKNYSPFDLDKPLVYLSRNDAWTIGDACEGTQIFGATGSGKTSGSGKSIAKAFLQSGFGGLVLTAKPDERQLWERYCAEMGCSDSLIIVSPETGFKFNFLDYEMNRPGSGGGLTENLVNLFYNILEIAEQKGGGSGDPYWERAVKQMLRNTIDLISIAKGTISVMDMYEVITSAPLNFDEVQDRQWQDSSYCFELIKTAEHTPKSESKKRDLDFTARYWLNEFPNISDRTRSIIISSFTSMADCFLRGVLRDMFCEETNFFPELTHQGAIILLDLPIKEYNELGQYAQVLFKYIWQQTAERRNVHENPRPIFLWADESQNFITSYDQTFQTTARSSRACTVYLTQNLPNYITALSGGREAKAKVDAFMGNLQTKIFHANGDSITNTWAAELISKNWQYRNNMNASTSDNGKSFFPEVTGKQHGIGQSESLDYQVLPYEFTTLRKGGHHNNLQVDAIIFQGGKMWKATKKNHIHTIFSQV